MTHAIDVSAMTDALPAADRIATVFAEVTKVAEVLRAGINAAAETHRLLAQAEAVRAELESLNTTLADRRKEVRGAIEEFKLAAITAQNEAAAKIAAAEKDARERIDVWAKERQEASTKLALVRKEVGDAETRRDELLQEIAPLEVRLADLQARLKGL